MLRIVRTLCFLAWIGIFVASGHAQTGIISTYAGHPLPVNGEQATTQAIVSPGAITPDGAGGFYVASVQRAQVYRVTAAGIISVVAGNSLAGFSGDGGQAVFAQLSPAGLAVDGAGNLLIADNTNNRIRRVDTSGVITTIAGNGTAASTGDGGQATAASLNVATDIAVDAAGNFYVVEGSGNRVRKITAAGVISTVAGGTGLTTSSGDGGPATSAGLDPEGIAVDGAGNLYILERFNSRIRKVIPDGTISTYAGTGTNGYNGDGIPANTARLNLPEAVAVDTTGIVYISDLGNSRVRKVALDGTISTVAGTGTPGFSGDGGLATLAAIDGIRGIAVDGAGNVYLADGLGVSVADAGNQRVRMVTADGLIQTVAGDGSTGATGDGGVASLAALANPTGVTVDRAGNLYIADYKNYRIRKVTPDGVITTVAGSGLIGYNGDFQPATSASLNLPNSTAFDGAGNLYFAETVNARVRKVSPAGEITTFAGSGQIGFGGDGGQAIFAKLSGPSGVAFDDSGNLYISDFGNHLIRKVTPAGVISTYIATGVTGPVGLAVDGYGTLFVADATISRILKRTAGGVNSTVAGFPFALEFSGDGGLATSAHLSGPLGVALDADGNIFIADRGNNRVRMVTPDGIINTIAGNGTIGFAGDGGLATSASLSGPGAVAVDNIGNLYIADFVDSRIRKVTLDLDSVLSTSTILRADFNGDGKSDVLWQKADGSAAIWLMDGANVSGSGGLLGPGTGWRAVEVADFNGDGKSDIAWQHSDGSSAVWLMDGVTVTASGGLLGAGTGWSIKQVGDFNGDGKSDLVWRHTDGRVTAWLMDGLNTAGSSNLLGAATGWTVRRIGDFNGDGKSDLLWQHTDGSTALWFMDGLSVTSGGGLLGPGTGWAVTRVGDFNGDGKSDVVWQHANGSTAIWLLDGLSVTSGGGLLGPGTGWAVTRIGDFNGDGKSDILWQHTDGSVAIWQMNGLSATGTGGLIGPASGWGIRSSGDFNGDGKSDIIWQNVDGRSGTWLMDGLSSIDGGGLLGGGTGWRPAP